MASFIWPPQGSGGASGTVTSVGLADGSSTSIFTISGSPVTTSGTLTFTLKNESANIVFAGPTTGSAAQPTFRSLVAADIPALSYVTSVGLTAPSIFTVSGSPVTSSGSLAFSLNSQSQNLFLASPNGSSGVPTFRAIASADIPTLSSSKIQGTTTNDNAASGFIGEYIESVISSATNVSGATGVWGNMTSISLTAGDWDVTGVWTVKANGSAMTGNVITAISVNSGTTTTDQVDGSNQVNSQTASAGVDKSGAIPSYRLSLALTTTVYLKNNVSFTVATPQFVCRISARRMR